MMTLLLFVIDDALIERLGDRRVEVREEATAALVAKGKAVEARLRRVVTSDPEVEARIEIILEEIRLWRIELTPRGCAISPATGTPQPLERGRDGRFTCTIRGARGLVPLLRAEIDRPFDLDLPVAFELLAAVRGFSELIPALEERARETTDPTVRGVCERAIRFQKEDPCSPSP